ncbi:MAG: acetate kinase [Coprobacillus sp.]
MKKILVINSGSSSIKYQLIEMPSERVLVKGMVDAIGMKHSSFMMTNEKIEINEDVLFLNHEDGLNYIINALLKYRIVGKFDEIDACGHRVAHGGENFFKSVEINDEVEDIIDRLGILAPLHNPMNLLGYQILKNILPMAKHVAVFDTAFHQTIKEDAYMYPIPYHYYIENHIRKYGFHGTSCRYVSMKAKELFGEEKTEKMIICHLGNGASITAISHGKSIDTSMGLTPLGGIMMGTRCGDIDPSIVEYVSQLNHLSVTEVLSELNYKSGLLGLSDDSFDMRVVCEKMNHGDEKEKIAIDVYIKRIVDYIGSYYLQLGGLDALVLTAGIGENSSFIRDMIIEKIKEPLAITVNENNECYDDYIILSSLQSKVLVCMIRTNEEMMIAKDTYNLIV